MPDKQTLIKKYWAGTATTEERQQLLQLLSQEDTSLEQELRTAFEADLTKNPSLLDEKHSELILQQILAKKSSAGTVPLERHQASAGNASRHQATVIDARRWTQWTAYAAAAVLAVAGIWLAVSHKQQPAPASPVAQAPVTAPAITTRYANTGDKKMTIRLADSSTVVLMPNTVITYSTPGKAPDQVQREIGLSGKAYFRVVNDPGRPFTVVAGGIATTVLGTEFTMSSTTNGSPTGTANSESRVEIRLISGKVKVFAVDSASTLRTIYLQPGQEEVIDGERASARLDRFSPAAERDRYLQQQGTTAAREPSLVFDKTPLTRVFGQLGVRYQLHFTYEKDDIRELQFTGTFLKSDPLPMMLTVICNMNGLAYKKQGANVSIYKMK